MADRIFTIVRNTATTDLHADFKRVMKAKRIAAIKKALMKARTRSSTGAVG